MLNSNKLKGQLMVELVWVLALGALLLAGFSAAARVGLMRLKLFEGAVLGKDLLEAAQLTPSDIKFYIADYVNTLGVDLNGGPTIHIGRFLDTPSAGFYSLMAARVEVDVDIKLLNKLGLNQPLRLNEQVVTHP